jgi:Tfp pilus assembly protein PilF
VGSRQYKEGWRAVNQLIRQGGSWSGRERNVAYRNAGSGFEDVSFVSGLDYPDDGRGFAAFDYDHDGRQDLALTFRTGPRLRLLRNEHASGPWLTLALEGRQSNRDAVGAWVTLVTNQRRLHRFVSSGSGYLSQSSRRLRFALLAGEKMIEVEIEWPRGLRQRLSAPAASGIYRLLEGTEALVTTEARARSSVPERAQAMESLWLAEPVPAPAPIPKRALVTFYADWCPPCRSEVALWKKERLPFTVIDVDKTPMAAWNLFYRHLFDYREDLPLPASMLTDAQGRIAKVYRGVTPAQVIRADLQVLSGPALPFPGVWLWPQPRRNYADLATALADAGLLAEARTYFALAKPDEEMRVNYAALLLEQNEPGKSAELLREVLAANPRQPDALANLGLALLALKRPGEAERQFAALTALQPDDGAAHEWLALSQVQQGRLVDAIGSYERAVLLGRESAELLNHLGILYAETGDRLKAREVFRRGLRLDPEHASIKANLRKLE